MKEKNHLRTLKFLFSMIGCILCIAFWDDHLAFAEEVTVTQSDCDTRIIPDVYNTGAVEPEGGFVKVTDDKLPCTINGEEKIIDGASTNHRFVINLKYKHHDLNGKIVIENADLSDYTFVVYSPEVLKEEGRKVSFVFQNCKLKSYSGGRSSIEEISFEFNQCTFASASGSDVTFNRCRFGGGISDRLNLFVNCYVNDCYIYNPTSEAASEGEIHVDGIQIYGNNTDSTVKAENIHFDNCRFEMPPLKYPNAPKAYVNACIMLQTEFSDGDNMSFENCYINGGGFSVYAHGVKGTKLSNITFKNLYFGCAAKYGKLYSDKPEQDQVEWNEETWADASSIYVGTVTRNQEKNETTLCVTNDTNQKRYFRAYTSNGKYYDFSIDACPAYKEYSEKGLTFEEFPFDRIYTIPEYCDWVAVYEMLPTEDSLQATMKQVRFQNWTEEKSVKIKDVSASNLKYELSEDGTMTVSGFGNMPEFSSAESIPWNSQKAEIKKLVLKGVTSVSKGAFSDCVNLEEVEAEEVKTIGENAFLSCISLHKIVLSEELVSIGSKAFSVDADTYKEVNGRRDVYYGGTLHEWLNISFDGLESNPMYVTGGNLYVNGSDLVTKLRAQDCSVTAIKAYAFAGCSSLTEVDFTGVTEIGTYAFVKSGISGAVVIPETVKKFGTYAFLECSQIENLIWNSSNNVAMGGFQNTGIKEITISGNVNALSNWAFKGCTRLTKVTLPDTITRLSQQSFQNCSALKEINIPEGVTTIGNFVFSGCTSLEKLTLPDSVSSFGLSVFGGCTGLKEIRLSANLSDLGKSCFSNCKSLSVIYFPETACPAMAEGTFSNIAGNSVLVYIPENATGYTENDVLSKIAGHIYSTRVIEPDGCVSPGKEQYTCLLHENCESNYEKITQTIAHQPGESVSENVVPATSDTEGSYEEVCYCSVCGKELSRQKKVIEKLEPELEEPAPVASAPVSTEPAASTTVTPAKKKITIKGTALKKIVNKKKQKIEVTWKKVKGITGYEVQYSTSKNLKKGVRTKKITGASKGKTTITKLKKNKKYYVRIRTYKKIKGKKYISKWSKTKGVKIPR